MQNNDAIVVKNLSKSFKDVMVLKDINLTIKKGTMLALLGPNGAGKTTTVRILSTLLRPDAGLAAINGLNVVNDADEVRKIIGLTGQYAAVDEYLTGRENLIMMGRLYHLSVEKSKQRAEELLVQFDLVDAAARAAKTYSGGMRRRLDLAASLVATPPIIFLDEPTTGLDPRSRIAMWNVIQELKKNGATILLTTQYLDEADKLADHIAVIDHGVVIAEGTAEQLKAKVGKNRLELILEKAADLEKAEKALDIHGSYINNEERSISVPLEGSVKDIKHILNHLETHNIEIETMSLHKPTLDDVFLKLTGKEVASPLENNNNNNKN